jgi:aspartyl-tRNA(Asn)/glutamyl-tRNA(Gln) amidotransferase subunit A
MAETASNLSRLDGTNYGARIEGGNLKDTYSITRSKKFSEETKRRIVGGNQVLSQGFSDEIYLKAQSIRAQISEQFSKDFAEVDLIISPVTPATPPRIGESLKDPMAMYLSDAYTVGFSLGGLPTLTIPKGTATGIQITADKKKDVEVLQFANFLNDIL